MPRISISILPVKVSQTCLNIFQSKESISVNILREKIGLFVNSVRDLFSDVYYHLTTCYEQFKNSMRKIRKQTIFRKLQFANSFRTLVYTHLNNHFMRHLLKRYFICNTSIWKRFEFSIRPRLSRNSNKNNIQIRGYVANNQMTVQLNY